MNRRLLVAWVALALGLVAGPGCQEKQTVVAPALSATCEVRPASGAAPLTVSFVLNVAGAEGPFAVGISYGDGGAGTNPDSPHTYVTAGSFTASFEVTTATQSARCAVPVTVTGGTTATVPPSANQPANAVFKSTPDAVRGEIAGTAPLAVRFNMCASTDPEKDTLYFLMDFDGDGKWEVRGTTGASCRRDSTYGLGTHRAVNCLTDVGPGQESLHPYQCRTYTVTVTP